MPELHTKGLRKVYGKRAVVDDVAISLRDREIVGLLGPNGAGKTTTFSMICGITPPTEGAIYLDDVDISRVPMYKRARLGIGYLAQNTSIFRKLTVEANIQAILETLRLTKAEQAERLEYVMTEVGIADLANQRANTLSGGERRRTEIARALAARPQFLLLDEPFSGVDPKTVEELQVVIEQLRSQGLGILITDHSVRATLSVTDRSYVISDGKILTSGTARELVDDPIVREVYLGDKFYMQDIESKDSGEPNETPAPQNEDTKEPATPPGP